MSAPNRTRRIPCGHCDGRAFRLVLSGHWVRWCRTRHGLSLRALGKSVGATAAHLCDIENGNRYPSMKLTTRIMKELAP